MGPYVAGVFDPRSWGNETRITLEVMRIVLATGLFAIGVELPHSYMAKHSAGLLVMVVPTMAFGWGVVASERTDRFVCTRCETEPCLLRPCLSFIPPLELCFVSGDSSLFDSD
jgi:hypothetical protein